MRNERWYLKNAGTPNEHIAVDGQYSYLDPDGKRITIVYYADENGYFAQREEVSTYKGNWLQLYSERSLSET